MPQPALKPPPKESKRVRNRSALLREAAMQINAYGVGGINLASVTSAAGLSRNALYYYVRERDELAFACFIAACDALDSDLDAALRSSEDPSTRLRHFIQATLVDREEPVAVLGKSASLGDPWRTQIAQREASLLEKLARLIEEGIQVCAFRPFDAKIAAQCLLGMLNWVRIAPNWLGEASSRKNRERLASAIAELMLHGIGGPSCVLPMSWPDAEPIIAPRVNPFDREEAASQKRNQLVATASLLFNRHGIDGTSLNDLSEAVGATKGAFFHYFPDKSALVSACYERAFDIFEQFIVIAERTGTCGLEKALIVQHLNCQAQASDMPPLMLQVGLDALPAGTRDRFIARARHIWFAVQSFLNEGKVDGSCRDGDMQSLAEAAAGSFAWLAEDRGRQADPKQIGELLCDLAAFGLAIEPK